MFNSLTSAVPLCHSYPVCETGLFDWRLVTIHLVWRKLLPRGPSLLQLTDLRTPIWGKEADRAYRGVNLTTLGLMITDKCTDKAR